MTYGRQKMKTECVINGKRQNYDACSTNNLKKAKKFYKEAFVYIGSGTGELYINGIKNMFPQEHHFFIYKSPLSDIIVRRNKLLKINDL